MVKGLYRSSGGMMQRMYEQDILANNLANLNTTGYKKDGGFLKQLIDAELTLDIRNGKTNFIGDQSYSSTYFEEGKVVGTGNPLDVAITGDGFFEINTPDGIRYTRNGNFKLDVNGVLVDQMGNPVNGQGGQIVIEGDVVQISPAGEVLVDGQTVDFLNVVSFNDPDLLVKEGNNLFDNFYNEPVNQATNFQTIQGSYESSNVDAVRSMVDMIEVHRSYDSNSRVLTATDESLRKLVNDVSRY
ncbi:MAG: flagellar basal-body rod protein FlgF [Candidatus Delongbacteria bacterium]|nr:flagellar basal-body rod protein FlgF [Candidatus Delongbacteria bacterium]MBN2833347.1 flagellar basal-body rod protein FlgF [Candidatus Delongbacteria bacterium]